jgi:hypothetical protein
MQMIEKQLVYLYCVTNKEPKLTETKDSVDNLYFICHRGLCAVASKVEESEFDEEGLKKNMADLEWVKANASTHERIIEGVMASADVIPFKFGTLFKNMVKNLKQFWGNWEIKKNGESRFIVIRRN